MSDESEERISKTEIEESIIDTIKSLFDINNEKSDIREQNIHSKMDSIKNDLREDNINSEKRVLDHIRSSNKEVWDKIDDHSDTITKHGMRLDNLEDAPEKRLKWINMVFGKGGLIAMIITLIATLIGYFGLK